MKEKDIQIQIVRYLNLKKMGHFFTVDNKGTFDPKKKVFRKRGKDAMPKGVSDILGVCADGVFCAIEVKTPQRRSQVTPDQENFLKRVAGHGGRSGVATSLDEAILIAYPEICEQ